MTPVGITRPTDSAPGNGMGNPNIQSLTLNGTGEKLKDTSYEGEVGCNFFGEPLVHMQLSFLCSDVDVLGFCCAGILS